MNEQLDQNLAPKTPLELVTVADICYKPGGKV